MVPHVCLLLAYGKIEYEFTFLSFIYDSCSSLQVIWIGLWSISVGGVDQVLVLCGIFAVVVVDICVVFIVDVVIVDWAHYSI